MSRDGIRKPWLVVRSVCYDVYPKTFSGFSGGRSWTRVGVQQRTARETSYLDIIQATPHAEIHIPRYVDSTGNWTSIVKSAVTDIQHSLRGKQLHKNVGTRMLCECFPDDKTNDFQISQNGMVANTNPRGKNVDKNQVLMNRMTWSGERIIQGHCPKEILKIMTLRKLSLICSS